MIRALQAAEKLIRSIALYQGTTSVVPIALDKNDPGFSPCGLSPENRL
jgi:hypothetical protein